MKILGLLQIPLQQGELRRFGVVDGSAHVSHHRARGVARLVPPVRAPLNPPEYDVVLLRAA